jgi:hypothetical protein
MLGQRDEAMLAQLRNHIVDGVKRRGRTAQKIQQFIEQQLLFYHDTIPRTTIFLDLFLLKIFYLR